MLLRSRSLFLLSLLLTGALAQACGAAPLTRGNEQEVLPSATSSIPVVSDAELRPEDEAEPSQFTTVGWKTDFTRRGVSLADIQPGGPPRDGIPSIDTPRFIDVEEATAWLGDREPVQVVEVGDDIHAYPTQILMWHEIVNDTVGRVPVAVTYCPLCNTAIVFNRSIPGIGDVEFGVTGNLYQNAMVMYDRSTESWFSQVSGIGIVGALTDVRLEALPSVLVPFEEFRRSHPDGQVLSRDTGFDRSYGSNPYVGYDTGQPFFSQGIEDDRLSAMERVVAIELNGIAAAIPFSILPEEPVIAATIGGESIVVLYRPGTASPLDASAIIEGRDIGSTGVYRPFHAGRLLHFEADAEGFRDRETGSTWNLLGKAIGGPLDGAQLEPILHGNHFWFSWAVYQPETIIIGTSMP